MEGWVCNHKQDQDQRMHWVYLMFIETISWNLSKDGRVSKAQINSNLRIVYIMLGNIWLSLFVFLSHAPCLSWCPHTVRHLDSSSLPFGCPRFHDGHFVFHEPLPQVYMPTSRWERVAYAILNNWGQSSCSLPDCPHRPWRACKFAKESNFHIIMTVDMHMIHVHASHVPFVALLESPTTIHYIAKMIGVPTLH